jgi:HEAT repeat protein
MNRLERVALLCVLGSVGCVLGQTAGKSQAARPAPSKPPAITPAVREEIDRLMSDDAGKRASAAMALSEIPGQAGPTIPYLIAILDDTKEVFGPVLGRTRVREVALHALRQIGRPAVVGLLSSLDAQAPDIREGATWALGELKAPEAVQPLIDRLPKETENDVLRATVKALAAIGDKRALPALISVSSRPIGEMDNFPGAVAGSIGSFKDPRAIEPLISLAERTSEAKNSNQYEVLRQVEALTGQKFRDEPKAARAWWEQNKSKYQ